MTKIVYIYTRQGINEMTSDNGVISRFLKEKRKVLSLTQIQLSEKAGVGLRFVREMEQGKTTLRMDKVNQVLKLFGQELGPIPMDRKKLMTDEKG